MTTICRQRNHRQAPRCVVHRGHRSQTQSAAPATSVQRLATSGSHPTRFPGLSPARGVPHGKRSGRR